MRALDVGRQDADVGVQRQIAEAGQEFRHLAGARPRALGEEHQALAAPEHALGDAQRLADRAAALHGDEIGQVLEVGAPPLVLEEIVRGRQRGQFVASVAQRDLEDAHVEVGRVVGGHEEVRMLRDVRLPAHLGLERLRVEPALRLGQPALAQPRDRRRQLDVIGLVVDGLAVFALF